MRDTDISKKRRIVRKIIRRTLYSLLGLAALLTLAASVATYMVFTPERITPIVLKYANDYLDAKLECQSMELTFFSTFPNFGIRLRNGRVVTRASDSLAVQIYDTLLSFSNFVTSFNPVALYRSNRLIVRHAWLEQPVIYACIDSTGRANWNILPETVDSTTSGGAMPEITVKNIHISDGYIVYDNHREATFVAAEGLQLDLGGTLTDVNLKMGIAAASVFINGKSYSSRLPLSLAASVKSDGEYRHFSIEKSSVSAGFVDFDITGTVERDTCDNSLNMAVDFNLHAASLADLLDAVPEHLFDTRQFPAAGNLSFSGRIEGIAGKGRTPLCTASLQLQNGEVKNRKQPDKPLLQQIEIDCDARLDQSGDSPSYIKIKTLRVKNESTSLSMDGVFGDIFTKPFIDARIDGAIDFLRFWENMPSGKDLMNMNGTAKLNLAGKCFIDDLLESDYGKIDAVGSVDVNGASFNFPSKNIALYAPMTKIRVGSHVTDSIRGQAITSLFRATAEMDSLIVRWSNDLSLDAGLLQATFRTSEPKDTVSISEIGAYIRLNNLRMQSAVDSMLRMQASRLSAFVRLGPQAAHPEKTELTSRLTVDSLFGSSTELTGRIHKSSLALTLRYRDQPARQRPPSADSLIRSLRRDSLMLAASRNSSAIDFQLGKGEAREFLSHWDVAGSFTGQSISLQTPWFPLRTRLSATALSFTSDSISVASAHLQAGESNMHLKGKIAGIRRALLRNGQIRAKFDMETDSLDCNEIIRALAAASDYAERKAERDDLIEVDTADDETEIDADSSALAIAADTLPAGLIAVPRNLDVELDARMRGVRYSHLNLSAAGGKIIVRNGAVRIPSLNIRSALGNADLSMVYKAPTTKNAYIGLDVHSEYVRVGELVRSLPMLDSLAPVMRSLEGVVECRITAVGELDSLSNVRIPATRASCYIKGKNMALLDGETFAKIAKTLHFKNKKRNIIDSVAVEFALDDSKIYVFPFVMSIDRYTAAIGGTQNLDLSFQYHISILKWSVPLVKVGLNIWGTPDNVHYGLASRKYADMSTPVKTQSLESTVLNLRQELYKTLRQNIDDILNEKPSIRRSPLMDSAVNNRLFSMDSVNINVPADSINDAPDSINDASADSININEIMNY